MYRKQYHENLNGLWEFQEAQEGQTPAFGTTLEDQILVPFPVESCLSGLVNKSNTLNVPPTYQHMWYRTLFDGSKCSKYWTPSAKSRCILHFGAVDWQTDVYVNGLYAGSHTGGYDGFSFDVTDSLSSDDTQDEIFVVVHDPSNLGPQPFGKQRISAMYNPGGDTYTPSSGIWQTVWVEAVPPEYIESLTISADTEFVTVRPNTNVPNNRPVKVEVWDNGKVIASGTGTANFELAVKVPSPKLWSPESPFLYNMTVTLENPSVADYVDSYFGMRTVELKSVDGTTRPVLNGKFRFFAGFLDQSWWPDGQYTAPGDEALAFDLKATKQLYGMNMIRLHQKVNSEQWYYIADTLGIVIFQDMVQHYGDGASIPEERYYWHDLKAMIDGRGNHPSIIQWETFNEGDMVKHFNATNVVEWTRKYDPTRLVDTNSGGPANNLKVGQVNDIHDYPWPKDPKPSPTQYAMVGEFGGLGAFVAGHMWTTNGCFAYDKSATPQVQADTYVNMTENLIKVRNDVSASVYTQTTDLERECDGFLNYDRTNKFSDAQTAAIATANQKLIGTPI